ncbi:LysR family transcriptional regulator [Chromobacterium haemolyticum]|uniref:LysR family transcriptional regulator n=1 Tax=Chromobacterium haemolyticum TaxID=394935 RepID=UPI0005BDFFDD|nr:LysR family transcriptional regulator [Chromobacterium haemolyticum]
MENFGAFQIFVKLGELRSFTAAGNHFGISTSAVSKAIFRLEKRLGVRLFHRSTRNVTLTQEGMLFLERCRSILDELEAAENEISQSMGTARGRIKLSIPSIGVLLMPRFTAFSEMYPEVELDIDFSDRMVDLIEEGFDAVIRTGASRDSRLMSRNLSSYKRVIVGSPAYLKQRGTPQHPRQLTEHSCLLYRFPSTGKVDIWPLQEDGKAFDIHLTPTMVANSLAPQVCFAENGRGLACLPDIAIREQLKSGTLVKVLEEYVVDESILRVMWPSNRHLLPKIRKFVDFVAKEL